MRLAGKLAVITGAASGFGEGIALRFAHEGATVVVNDINATGGERVAAAIRAAAARRSSAPATSPSMPMSPRWSGCTLDALGRIDVIVNNAGTTHRNRPMLEVTRPSSTASTRST